MPMTRKQLQDFHREKTKFIESVETLERLKKYLSRISSSKTSETENNCEAKDVQAGIEELEEAIMKQREIILSGEREVLRTIALIEDNLNRTAAKLHYYNAWPWCVVASAMGVSERAITTRVQTALKEVTLPK